MIAVIILMSLFSCVSKKEQIVDRMQAINTEIKIIDDSLGSLRGAKAVKESMMSEVEIMQANTNMSRLDSFQLAISEIYSNLKSEYDSLEIELKKY